VHAIDDASVTTTSPAWLADVLARFPDYPANQVADLPSWNWKANQQSKAAVAA
jgi:transposase